jgi:hypothetical protein
MTSRWTFSFGQERGKDHVCEINENMSFFLIIYLTQKTAIMYSELLIIHVEIKCMARTAQK